MKNNENIASRPARWCKRNGHNRICLTCGRNIKSKPAQCASVNHRKSFQTKQKYNRFYFQRHKRRLMKANRIYRAQHPQHKVWARAYHRTWYAANRDRKRMQNKAWEKNNVLKRRPYLQKKALQWYYHNHQRAKANNRLWYSKNRHRKNCRRNELLKAQRSRDPGARIRFNLRTRLSMLVRKSGRKTFSICRDVLLYTANELRTHLEKQFKPGMNWQNYGRIWEVDHIRPCANFDLSDLAQCRKCFALTNLRPLELQVNRGRYFSARKNRPHDVNGVKNR